MPPPREPPGVENLIAVATAGAAALLVPFAVFGLRDRVAPGLPVAGTVLVLWAWLGLYAEAAFRVRPYPGRRIAFSLCYTLVLLSLAVVALNLWPWAASVARGSRPPLPSPALLLTGLGTLVFGFVPALLLVGFARDAQRLFLVTLVTPIALPAAWLFVWFLAVLARAR